ncbi:hypothetical protein BKA66DRAFT_565395 [Pyrenochaeta sp. MPI-SDFR-AT-0127]|nr:hypothetical protein BKA66DRAFT_565395 [Pyrenochaeta sp. MPI-SDFR-AT-0127]
MTTDLFLVLIIVISMILLIVLLYFLIRWAKRHRSTQRCKRNLQVSGEKLSRQRFRPQIGQASHNQQQHYMSQQRVSSPPPSVELLSQIKTNEDKAERWLERGKVDEEVNIVERDLGLNGCKTLQVPEVKADGDSR